MERASVFKCILYGALVGKMQKNAQRDKCFVLPACYKNSFAYLTDRLFNK